MKTQLLKFLLTYQWNGKNFTSQSRLNEAYIQKMLRREVAEKFVNGFFLGAHYTFFTLENEKVAQFYLPSGFDFGTQATGVEI